MAGTLYISEYSDTFFARNFQGLDFGQKPSTDSTVEFDATVKQSNVFQEDTKLVRLIAKTDSAHINFGTNPNVSSGNKVLQQDVPEYFGVEPGIRLAVTQFNATVDPPSLLGGAFSNAFSTDFDV
jgi:hypothetical protein